jgi:hypothetical protein
LPSTTGETSICYVTRNRLLVDRQLDVLERIEPGLHLRDDRAPVLVGEVNRQPVGAEQVAQLLRQLEDDLVDILGRVDLVGDRLQLLLKTQPLGQAVVADRLAVEYGAHRALNQSIVTALTEVPGFQFHIA